MLSETRGSKLVKCSMLALSVFVSHFSGAGAPKLIFADTNSNEDASTSKSFFLSQDEIRQLESKASDGDGIAAFKIAQYYRFSAHSTSQYVDWLQKSERLGNPIAGVNLAFYYRYTKSPPDYGMAFEMYHKWASKGDAGAFVSLAEMYEDGLGTQKDTQEALKWYQKAARAGKVFTMEKASGLLLNSGRTVEAYAWAEVALERRKRAGIKFNEESLQGLASRLTPSQVKEANEQAAELDRTIPQIEPWTNW